MKKVIILFLFLSAFFFKVLSQDTFSIVAIDSITGEVGSAGASCVDLFNTSFSNDDFLGVLIPGVGAINTQASYLPTNQTNATNRMLLGEPPDSIISWLVSNDVQNNPAVRQYGIAAFVGNSPKSAAHTGASTFSYKNHILGANYSIQGNILLGQQVLDSMEARFLRESGDLSCKLMAALQGAKMIGADTRCTNNGTSSLFAFVKVSQPGDSIGFPSFKLSVRTHNGDQIEPIDSLQKKFDLVKSCGATGLKNENQSLQINVSPVPCDDQLKITTEWIKAADDVILRLYSSEGRMVKAWELKEKESNFSVSDLEDGIYFYKIISKEQTIQSGKIIIKH